MLSVLLHVLYCRFVLNLLRLLALGLRSGLPSVAIINIWVVLLRYRQVITITQNMDVQVLFYFVELKWRYPIDFDFVIFNSIWSCWVDLFFFYKIIVLVLTNRAVMHKKFSAFLGKKKVFWESTKKCFHWLTWSFKTICCC